MGGFFISQPRASNTNNAVFVLAGRGSTAGPFAKHLPILDSPSAEPLNLSEFQSSRGLDFLEDVLGMWAVRYADGATYCVKSADHAGI